jgi:hypothetical protein
LRFLKPVPDLLEPLDLLVGALADVVHLAVGRLADLALGVGLGALRLELGEVLLEDLAAALDVGVAAVLDLLLLDLDLRLERGQVLVALLLVDRRDHVGREVDDLLEVLRGQVEQVPEPARDALEVPDVGDGAASSMWPIRSRRTLARVTSTPQRSQMMPLKRTRLYLPQLHSQSRVGPKMRSQNSPSFSGLRVR